MVRQPGQGCRSQKQSNLQTVGETLSPDVGHFSAVVQQLYGALCDKVDALCWWLLLASWLASGQLKTKPGNFPGSSRPFTGATISWADLRAAEAGSSNSRLMMLPRSPSPVPDSRAQKTRNTREN